MKMKLKKKRAVEVPPKIKHFISGVTATPLENIEEPLKSFVWDFDKGDFHHWVDLFNYFDTFFEKYIKSRKDLLLEDDFLEHDPPFPREAVLQILRVVRIILDNCTNKHFYSPYEHHLSSLLASTDVDVVEASLQTLAAFLKKPTGKYVVGDASLNSKLFAFAQGWGGKEEGLGLVACAIENGSDSVSQELGSTLHFEFYVANESLMGLQIIHLPNVNTYRQCDRELMQKLIKEYKVPDNLRFSLLTRLRFARAFGSSAASRLKYTCIQLHAFLVFVQVCGENDDLVTFFNTEPEFINELVTLLSYEDAAPKEVRILCLLSLVSLCRDRSRQLTVLSALTSGGPHGGILSSLTQKAIDDVVNKPKPSKWFVVFAEALISLVTILVSSPLGCSAMREAGFITTLLPLLKDSDPQHLHLVSLTVNVLKAFMESSNSAAVLFQDLGGLDDAIFRLKVEVSHVENRTSADVDITQPLYSEALVSCYRRSLMIALLRVISVGTHATGIISRVFDSEENLLPNCLCVIFRNAKTFGGRVFSLAAIVMSDLIHKDPTCFSLLEAYGLPSAFLGAIMDGVLCSSEAITCIPQCLDALCLNNSGLQAVKDHNALRCFVKIFSSRHYLCALTGDTPSSLSRGLDELLRHASSLRGHGVDVLIEILKAIEKLGYEQSGKNENSEKLNESAADTSLLNVESFLPDCVNNVSRLCERILQNSGTCRVFIEKKGVEAILRLFTLPLMPSSVSVGERIVVAIKHFSPHHCASFVRVLSSFMRQHLNLTNELLVSLGGLQLAQVEDAKRTHVLRCLSSLEGILSLSCSLAKGTTDVVSELATSDADLVRDLGATFMEILWQHSKIDSESLMNNTETTSQYLNRKSPEALVLDNLIKLASTLRSFFIALVKGFTSPNRRRAETGSLSADSKSIGTSLAKVFLEALSSPGYATSAGFDTKCRYLGKVVNHMAAVTFDSRHHTCYTVMINYFYVHGTFKELLNTFEATSQLLWTLPYSYISSLFNTLESYCHVLEVFVNSTFHLPPETTSWAHLVIQPVAVGLFLVPGDPKVFVRMLQSQVLDVILSVWNQPMFPCYNPRFITGIVTLLNHVYCGVSDANGAANANQRINAPLPDEATISAIVEMGFTRRRAEEALRHVERNSVEMAMEWLLSHHELAEAVALSLGSSSETPKADDTENLADSQTDILETKAPPIDDALATIMKLFRCSDSITFPLTDLLITLCNRDKGEERPKVISCLIQRLKLYSPETSKDTSVICTISHTLALLLSKDVTTREIAAENGIVSVVLDLLIDFKERKSRDELLVSKCISALLLILDSLSQSRPKSFSDSIEGTKTGYLTIEEGKRVITVVCDMIKQHVPGVVMHGVLLVCASLTKTHTLALHFLENGGMVALFTIPRTCSLLVYDTVASSIIRHLLEDPQTLQTAMELEIRQTLTANFHRIPPRTFLTSMAPLISRDPEIFMKAAAAICQLESSGGRTFVVLSKEKEKEKDKSKVPENKSQDGLAKSKNQKKISANLTQVIHHMLEIILKYPEESEGLPEGSEEISKLTFLLKLLSDILLMYVNAVGIVLKRDLEMGQLRGHGGIVNHIMHWILLDSPVDKNSGSDESRAKLSEKASGFLVVLCGRSSEGRRRVVNELVKALRSFSNSASNSSKGNFLPDEKLFAFVHLLYSILSKNSSSGNLMCSLDIAKGMIDGGMIPCLSSILQVLDLDHPDAPKVVNIIIQVLEGLTRAANASEQLSSSDLSNKKKKTASAGTTSAEINQTAEANLNSHHEVTGTDVTQQGDVHSDLNQPAVQEMRAEMEETETIQPYVEFGTGFVHEEMEDGGVLQNSDQNETAFHVDNREGDEDDDMGDDDDVDGDDEDEDDVEDHDETAMGDEYYDMVDDDEDGDYHENFVTEGRWRAAVWQLIGQEAADSGVIDMATEPREVLNVHRLQGQQNRTTFEGSGTEGNGLQHPLLLRPSQSGDFGSMCSPGGNPSHNLESLYTPGRRGVGENRWTDDGQPQAGGQAAAIAQAIEEQLMSQLHNTSSSSLAEARQPHNSASQISLSDAPLAGVINLEQVNSGLAVEQTEDIQARGPSLVVGNASSNGQDNMEIGEGDGSVNQQELQRDSLSATDNNHQVVTEGDNVPNSGDYHAPVEESADVDMDVADSGANENGDVLSSEQITQVAQDNSRADQADETGATNVATNINGIDPTFLEALPEYLRAEVLASQQVQSTPAPAPSPAVADDIDPEFLAALPPDIQAEVLAQQRAQRIVQQAQGQPVEMDNASIIATFPADLRHEVLLTSSEAVISALPSLMLAEAQMLRDRAMSHYRAQSLFASSNQRLNNRRNGFDRRTVIDRGVGITVGRKASYTLTESLKVKEVEGEPLLDTDALKAFVRLLRLAKPLGEGLLQRLLLNLCAHSCTRAILVYLLLDMIKPETKGPVGGLTKINSKRLYGCQSNVVYGRSQLIDGLPPLVLSRVLEILTYLAINHSCVADILFYFDTSRSLESLNPRYHEKKNDKGKEKVVEGCEMVYPILLFVKLLNHGSNAHLEQVLGLLQVVVCNAALKLDRHSQRDSSLSGAELGSVDKSFSDGLSTSDDKRSVKMYDLFIKLPQADLVQLCSLLGHKGLSDKVYTLTGKVLKKLASIASLHKKFFIVELSNLAHNLSSSAIHELITLRNTKMLGLSAGSMAGASVLRILQTLNSLTVLDSNGTKGAESDDVTMWRLNASLGPLWHELSECIKVTESQLGESSFSSITLNANISDSSSSLSPPLPPGTQRLLPFIEAFLVLCEKLQENSCQKDNAYVTASEVKQLTGSSPPSGEITLDVTFDKFAEKHRRLLNAFVRQDPTLLEKSLSMLLKAPWLMDFDNKRSYFRSRLSKQNEQNLAGPLRISVRRAYILEDSYNQIRMRSSQEMKRRLNVHFQGEEGVDAGGLTREWYQSLSRVIFDKGALLFTTVGNNATFQPNPNSVYQTEHLSYFIFVGRVVAKALFDGQLLDAYFTRSFYKHILGVKVTYHDIEAVDPDYYKNLKWMLENDISDIPDLTFSMDADEEKHILYEKTEVTDYELKPGGRNIRVTEETKHEYVDLVAEHILTNAIRPQINSFLDGFNELIPREHISIFNDKELELLINGLPEIDFDDLKANTEYTGYTTASSVIIWFWEVVKAFNKEDQARLLQFVTGTSKVPLEGFKALQGISGPQNFQIHKAYGAPERLPSAHTCFNQLDLPEYMSKEQLQERLLLAIHEASEGFGFG